MKKTKCIEILPVGSTSPLPHHLNLACSSILGGAGTPSNSIFFVSEIVDLLAQQQEQDCPPDRNRRKTECVQAGLGQ
jgi:hypothetical protein